MKNNAFIEKKLGKSLDEVSKEELIALISELKNEKKYGLVWEDQVEEMEKLLETHYPMLQEDADKAIVTDPTKPTNLIIEGDNLHSLNTLLYTHREKVDVIYIDPPYNTGNKDFVYNDRYVDKEDSWRHSSWLSFMEKRLRLAKELLSENGVIFISIDDNEQAQLKLLCDEIFGEQNHLTNFIWKKNNDSVRKNVGKVLTKNEYIVCYQKSNEFKGFKTRKTIPSTMSNPDNDPRGEWFSANISNPVKKESEKNVYEVNIKGFKIKRRWFKDRDVIETLIKEDRIYLPVKNGIHGTPRQKLFIEDFTNDFKTADNFILEFPTTEGRVDLEELNMIEVFSYPKPVNLLKHLVNIFPCKNASILDFFAGSGTTGHAVLELNAEDGGNRQFILCTHGKESETSTVNIAEDITYERIKRVINGYTTPKGKDVEGLPGNVKYYKTVLVERNQDNNDLKEEMAQHAKDLLCIKENIFTETVSIDDESFLFENEQLVMGIHLGEYYDVPEALSTPLAQTTKQKLIYLKVDNIPTDEQELLELMEAGIIIKPIPKKIMDLFDESTRR